MKHVKGVCGQYAEYLHYTSVWMRMNTTEIEK